MASHRSTGGKPKFNETTVWNFETGSGDEPVTGLIYRDHCIEADSGFGLVPVKSMLSLSRGCHVASLFPAAGKWGWFHCPTSEARAAPFTAAVKFNQWEQIKVAESIQQTGIQVQFFVFNIPGDGLPLFARFLPSFIVFIAFSIELMPVLDSHTTV